MSEASGKIPVLLVDDATSSLQLIKRMLEEPEDFNFEIYTATDGSQALELFERVPFGIALIDWMIPEINGLDIITEVRRREREGLCDYCYLIMVTVRDRVEDVITSLDQGADDFVAKPFDRRVLTARGRAGKRVVENRALLRGLNDTLHQRIEKGERVEAELLNYMLMANASSDYITLIDRHYCYCAVNEAYLKARRKSHGDILGHTLVEVWGEQIFNEVLKTNVDIALTGSIVHYESLFGFTPTGSRFMDVTFYPYRNEHGEVSHVVITSHDITKVKRAEEEIRKLFHAVEHSPMGILIADAFGTIKYVNPEFLSQRGEKPGNLLGDFWRDTLVGRENKYLFEEIWAVIATGREWIGELSISRSDGLPVWYSLTITPILGEDTRVTDFIALREDITEQVEAEQARDDMHQQLLQSAKLATLGELSAGIAHELNNVLTLLLGHAEELEHALEQENLDRSTLRKSSANILEVAERMNKIATQMRKSAHGPMPEFVTHDVRQILEDTLFLMNKKIRNAGVTVQSDFAPELPPVNCDPGQIEQVVLNILTNALAAMEGRNGGLIRITTAVGADRGVDIAVWNDGPLIPPEVLEHLFEPFFTTKPRGIGTGLGMSIAATIMRNHGGRLEAKSAIDLGTSFTLSFPAVSGASLNRAPFLVVLGPDQDERAELARRIAGYGYRVEVVEDQYGLTALCADSSPALLFCFEEALDDETCTLVQNLQHRCTDLPIVLLQHRSSGACPPFARLEFHATLRRPLSALMLRKLLKGLGSGNRTGTPAPVDLGSW